MWMIRGPPRAPDRLLESFGTRARRSEVFEIMMGACGPINSGGSATIYLLFFNKFTETSKELSLLILFTIRPILFYDMK